MQKRALIIEDDYDIANLVAVNLRDIDCDADIVGNGLEGVQYAARTHYDIIILDVMLPKLDGMQVVRRIREHQVETPILMVTARAEEADKIQALNLGADDYITKPFSVRELVARVKARLRRFSPAKEPSILSGKTIYSYAGLTLDSERRKVILNGETVELTVKEFDLLSLFMKNPGRAYSRADLLDIIWGYSYSGYEHTVNSHINRLRTKIEADAASPKYVLTVWGVGYKFNDDLA